LKFRGLVQNVIGISAKLALEGKILGQDSLLQESNYYELTSYLESFVVSTKETLKEDTLFDEFASLLINDFSELEYVSRYYDAGMRVDEKKYKDRCNTLISFKNSVVDICRILYAHLSYSMQLTSSALFLKACLAYLKLVDSKEKIKPADYLQQAKNGGNTYAILYSAELCLEGKNYSEVLTMAAPLASVGNIYAQSICGNVLFAQKKFEQAFQYFSLDRFPVPHSLYFLGIIFLYGKGVQRDVTKGISLLQKAAAEGYGKANLELAKIYLHGKLITCNFDLAKKYLKIAVGMGSPLACKLRGDMFALGMGENCDKAQALFWYRIASYMGNVAASYKSGEMYSTGDGCNKDYKAAFDAYLCAARQGYENAAYIVGKMYVEGKGTNIDLVEAVKWYKKAADKRDQEAINALAMCYVRGKGIAKNWEHGYSMLISNANAGNAEAKKLLISLDKETSRKIQKEKIKHDVNSGLDSLRQFVDDGWWNCAKIFGLIGLFGTVLFKTFECFGDAFSYFEIDGFFVTIVNLIVCIVIGFAKFIFMYFIYGVPIGIAGCCVGAVVWLILKVITKIFC